MSSPGLRGASLALGSDIGEQPAESAAIWQALKRRWWRELPDAPSAPMVETASAESLVVTCEIPGSTTDIAGFDIEFRVHNAAEYAIWEHAVTGTATTVSGLTPSTLYHVRVRAVNDAD